MTAPFTLDGLRRGMRDAAPLALGVFIYGIGFGLVAAQVRFTLAQSLAMGVTVYSGSAQLAAASLISSGHATLTALAATILLINARYLMFGAALQPWLSATTPPRALASLLMVGDANWLMTMRNIEVGEQDRAYLAGTGLPMLGGWLAGITAGFLSGSVISDPRVLGADLMLPAFAAAMMAGMMKTRAAAVPAVVGAATAVAVLPLAGPGWAIIAAGLLGGGMAAALWRAPA